MRILLTLSVIIGISIVTAFAQAPQQFNYQGVVRDNNGAPLENGNIALQVSIRQNSPSGTIVYQENQSALTNEFGIFNIRIGGGNVSSGSFQAIDWGVGAYYVETSMDASGGSNYQSMGTSQLLSVPYALYSEVSGTAVSGTGGQNSYNMLASNGNLLVYDYSDAFAWNAITGAWTQFTTEMDGQIDSVLASNGNFLIYNYDQAVAWSAASSTWVSFTTDSDGNMDGAIGSYGNFLVYNYNQAVAWNSSTETWTSVTTDFDSNIDRALGSKGNFLVCNYHQAVAWNSATGSWTSLLTSSDSNIGGAAGSFGNFLVYNGNQASAWSTVTNTWNSINTPWSINGASGMDNGQ